MNFIFWRVKMSMKENIEFIKDELTQEEKFLEQSVKFERFFKKYKKMIIGGVSVIVVAVIGYSVSNYIDALNKENANKLYQKAISNDNSSLKALKDANKKLYEVALFRLGQKTNAEFLSDIQLYEKAIKDKDIKILDTLSKKSGFLLKDFAIFYKAIFLIEDKKYQEAKNSIKFIESKSMLKDQIVLLKHYLLSK